MKQTNQTLKRSAGFIRIETKISEADSPAKLAQTKSAVLRYYGNKKNSDGGELLAAYTLREAEVAPLDLEEDSIESLHNKRT